MNKVLKNIFEFFFQDRYNAAKILIDNGANVNYVGNKAWTPLITSALNGMWTDLRWRQVSLKLLNIMPCFFHWDVYGLLFLCGILFVKICRLFLTFLKYEQSTYGHRFRIFSNNHLFHLIGIETLFPGNVNTARLFIERGANVNSVDEDGDTPLYSAARRGSILI